MIFQSNCINPHLRYADTITLLWQGCYDVQHKITQFFILNPPLRKPTKRFTIKIQALDVDGSSIPFEPKAIVHYNEHLKCYDEESTTTVKLVIEVGSNLCSVFDAVPDPTKTLHLQMSQDSSFFQEGSKTPKNHLIMLCTIYSEISKTSSKCPDPVKRALLAEIKEELRLQIDQVRSIDLSSRSSSSVELSSHDDTPQKTLKDSLEWIADLNRDEAFQTIINDVFPPASLEALPPELQDFAGSLSLTAKVPRGRSGPGMK